MFSLFKNGGGVYRAGGLIAHIYLYKSIFHQYTGKEKPGVCPYKHHVLTVIVLTSLRNLTSCLNDAGIKT